ncbi:MAG: hypothetical protein LC107_09985 [Chitinophagales bacterium]|nr:hypothetical protein [Chitinophagales bacterium]
MTLDNEIRNHLKKEQSILLEYFLYKLKNICINHPVENMLSKIEVLNRCRVHNIKFPDTIITTSKKSASIFFDRYKKIITKNITQGVFIFEQNFNYAMTQIVLRSDLDKLGDYFYPTMFQQYIPKLFDIRVFFLDKIFYSCLILSQKDKKTRIDFRNYNKERPNRIIKFDLPDYLKKNLVLLLEELNLKSDSIDLVMDKNGCFYFLEVNLVGQFGMTTFPKNYQLECEIAKYLKNENDKINTRN